MTENKRYSFNWERGHPQFWDNHCDLADCYLTCEDVCELLNELHEENLKLLRDCDNLIDDNTEFVVELNQNSKKLKELLEENEQLKKENKELRSDRNYWKTLSQSLAKTNGKR